MCPACLATLSMIVAGVISTGGATALAARTMLHRKDGKKRSGGAVVPGGDGRDGLKEKEKRS